ncbi:MAG TPA: SIR2 family protein [Coriobacteriia bacterium]|nr:SIR2 family protein [Coriobacteriia bacterium]
MSQEDEPRPGDPEIMRHCQTVRDAAREGEIVFLLGAGVNLCGRPEGLTWTPDGRYLPSGAELARHLAERFRLPPSEPVDLARVTQWVIADRGEAKLWKELHHLFDVECGLTPIHRFLAGLPAALRAEGSEWPQQFIVTTNYDDVLERAFREVGEPFDVYVYLAQGDDRGKVLLVPHEGTPEIVRTPNMATAAGRDRTAILKIHGAIDRRDAEQDSWVITEEDYIDYLTRTDIATWMPVGLHTLLKVRNLEFLGYSLRDWNLRAILHRLRQDRRGSWKWWAVQLESALVDRDVWTKHDLSIIDARLEDYVVALEAAGAAR